MKEPDLGPYISDISRLKVLKALETDDMNHVFKTLIQALKHDTDAYKRNKKHDGDN